MYAAVLPTITNSRKLNIRWSGPLIMEELINETMVKVREIRVKKPRLYTAHRTKLRLAKGEGRKEINPSFSAKDLHKRSTANGRRLKHSGVAC